MKKFYVLQRMVVAGGGDEICSNIYNEKCWVNNHAHVVVAKDGVSLQYLRNYLNYANLNSYITGATRGKLTRKRLDSIRVPLPKYEDQVRIATLLSRVEALIATRKNKLQQLDDLLKSTFLEMFGDPVRNEKGWEILPFDKVGRFVSGGTPSKKQEEFWVGEFPWVSPKDMKVKYIKQSQDHISESVFEKNYTKKDT